MGKLRVLNATLLALLTVLLIACAGGGSVIPRGSAPSVGGNSATPGPSGALGGLNVNFLSMGKLPAGIGDSPECDGSDFVTALLCKNISTSPPSVTLNGAGSTSYAVYGLRQTLSSDYAAIILGWDALPDGAQIWVGLSDYHKLKWDWRLPDWNQTVYFDQASRYCSGEGITYIAVVLVNSNASLRKVTVGDTLELGGVCPGGRGNTPWGDPVGEMQGNGKTVVAKSNYNKKCDYSYCGPDSGYGFEFQCVEFCRRWVYQAYGFYTPRFSTFEVPSHPHPAGSELGAWKWFFQPDNVKFTKHYNGGPTPPSLGDVVVFDWSGVPGWECGHVAVVKTVSLDGADPCVVLVQQNMYWDSRDGHYHIPMTVDGANYTLHAPVGVTILGWLHYGDITGGGGSPGSPPASFSASQGQYAGKVHLQWDYDAAAQAYELYRDSIAVQQMPGSYASWDDNVAGMGPFAYALSVERNGEWSGCSYASGWPSSVPPPAPSWVSASDAQSTNSISITWAVVSGATSYSVYIDFGSSPKVQGLTATSYVDTSIAPDGVPHYYEVCGVNAAGSGPKRGDWGWTARPPLASLSASPTSGNPPLAVAFDAGGSRDQDGFAGGITRYEWDWTNDGTYDYDSGTTPTSNHTYSSSGTFTAKVRVTDDDSPAQQATATIVINVTTGPTYTAYGYVKISGGTGISGVTMTFTGGLGAVTTNSSGYWSRDNILNGTYTVTPSNSGWTFNPNSLNFTIADGNQSVPDFTGSQTGSYWHLLTVDSPGNVGYYTSLATVNSNPAISYWDSANGDLKYARATDANGTSWNTYTVDSPGDVGRFTSLTVVNGNPAISYYDYTNQDLKFVRASDPSGSSSGSSLTVDSSGNVGFWTSLGIVNGNPAISYNSSPNYSLKYVRATEPSGSSWGSPVTVDSAGNVGRCTSIEVVNLYPAISYYDDTNHDLKFVRASDASGSSWGTPIAVDSAGDVGYSTSLAIVNGNPAVGYFDGTNEQLRFVRASNANGSSWGSPVTVDSAPMSGEYTSLAVVQGNPAISYSYFNWNTSDYDLKYGRATDANGTSWVTDTVDSAGRVGEDASLCEVNGKPAISYRGGTNGDELKFAIYY